jgi:hypothetical protein
MKKKKIDKMDKNFRFYFILFDFAKIRKKIDEINGTIVRLFYVSETVEIFRKQFFFLLYRFCKK